MKEILMKVLPSMGFDVELDKWDGSGYMRWRHGDGGEGPQWALVIYKDITLEETMARIASYLIRLGKYIKIKEINRI